MRWLTGLTTASLRLLGGRRRGRRGPGHREALELGRSSGQPDAAALHGFQLHTIRWHQGRGAEAVDALEELTDRVPLPMFRAALARVYDEIGRHDEAHELLAIQTAAGFPHLGDWSWLAEVSNWTEIAARADNRSAVDLLHQRLLPWSSQVICTRTHVAGAVAHYLGLLDAARADDEQAEAHFTTALDLHRRFRAPFHEARTHLAWGQMLLRSSTTRSIDEARTHLSTARDLARDAGCALVHSTAERLLGEGGDEG